MTVVTGDHNRQVVEQYESVYDLDSIEIHKQYGAASSKLHEHDIAILKTKNIIALNDHVQPVCLPTSDTDSYSLCVVSGWRNVETSKSCDNDQFVQLNIECLCTQVKNHYIL